MTTGNGGRLAVLIGVSVLVLALSGCGGGGGGGGSNPGGSNISGGAVSGGGTSNPVTLEYYYEQGAAMTLYAVDPASPSAAPMVVATNVASSSASGASLAPVPILGGTLDTSATPYTIDGESIKRVVYADSTGKFWQVTTNPSGTMPPTPQRMSSAQPGAAICSIRVGQDLNNVDKARVLYALDMGSGCNGALDWKITTVGASSTTAPDNFPGSPIVGLVNPSDGSHAGWLTLASGAIELYAPDGTTTPLKSGVTKADYFEGMLDGRVFLNVDGMIYLYDQSNKRLDRVGSSFTFGSSAFTGSDKKPEAAVTDGEALYFVDEHALYKADPVGKSVTKLEAPADAAPMTLLGGERLTVTPNYVVWAYGRDTNSDGFADEALIRSYSKAGHVFNTLDTVTPVMNSNQGVFRRSGGWFFCTIKSGGNATAMAYKADGTATRTYPQSKWIGDSLNLAQYGSLGNSIQIAYMISGLTSANQTALGGVSVQSVSGASPGTSPRNLGTLPNGVQAVLASGGYGDSRLLAATVDDGSGGSQQDVFFVDGSQDGSLDRQTDTSGVNEFPVLLF